MAYNMSRTQAQLPTPLTPSMPVCLPLVQEPIPSLPTPPDIFESSSPSSKPDSSAIKLALHVIATERTALSNLESLYQNDSTAQNGLVSTIDLISRACNNGGKVVVCGVGKSGKIGEKAVATFNSLGIQAVFCHATEALHGDLGIIKSNDVVLMITFSGRTPELLLLVPHIPASVPLIVMTSHLVPSSCPLLQKRKGILLPAPIHESEMNTFGVSAPTTSTVVAMSLCDCLALAVANRLHPSPAEVFRLNHPGGAIGAAAAAASTRAPKMTDLAIEVASVPIALASDGQMIRTNDIYRTAIRSPGGWVRVSPQHIIAPRRVQELHDMTEAASEYVDKTVVVEKTDWISVLGEWPVAETRQWIVGLREEARGKEFLKPGTILGIVDVNNEVTGVVEIEEVMGDNWSAQ